MKRIYNAIGNLLFHRFTHRLMPDKLYILTRWRKQMGYNLDLDNPRKFTEKLQYLKLYDRRNEYTTIVDKLCFKEWVTEQVGAGYTIPTIAVFKTPDEINLETLPSRFVLKCNHDSGSVFVCTDKATFDLEKTSLFLKKRLRYNYFWNAREWPYKNIKKRRIIVEEFLENDSSDSEAFLVDYKFFCFNGDPQIMYISNDHSNDPHTDFFDMDFNHLQIKMKDPNAQTIPEKPAKFEEMKEIAKKLSEGIPFVRVDMYLVHNQIFVGELTFYHSGGYFAIYPEEWNQKLGNLITLPNLSSR